MKDYQTPVRDALASRGTERGGDGAVETGTRHWRLRRTADGIAWLVLDRDGESANTISAEVLEDLDTLLGKLEADRPKALVLRSGKKNGFAAGADIRDFRGMTDETAIAERLREAHRVADRLAALPVPTVAVLHGFALGGGLELALACDLRLATPDAKLGFPEVMLGLHPGLGGTFRTTELIDPTEAMTMMLTGKSLPARKAKSLGLVDALVEERHVEAAVRAAVAGELKTERGGWKASLMGTAPARAIAVRRMRDETGKRARPEHYPGPHALIDLWEKHAGDARAMQSAEIDSFARLMAGPTAQNLIRVFFLRERLKALTKSDATIARVHVIGAGTMGGDIAAWCASRGLSVTLTDLDPATIAKAIGRANALFDDKIHESRKRRDARDRLTPDFDGEGVRSADIVIEAIAEKAEAKAKVYAEVEPRMKPGAVLATNTSSIPLESLRESLARPERLVGIHFFNPVAKMQLVEVVAHDGADASALDAARALCGRIDRMPAPVRSAPGFLVNRILTPYVLEAMLMIDEGAKPEQVDAAAEAFGMAMGPAEVADRVGLDICASVLDMLRERVGGLPEPPSWLRERIAKGELGAKSDKGLYTWRDGKPKKAKVQDALDTDRLILPLVNTSAACLREGVIDDADLLDGAMIFATGFAPFRGGPAKYARDRGLDEIFSRLEALAAAHGPRFRPDDGLDRLAEDA
jgi:3-hydroxyacyl-CoA dehydrogenase / enoyl-CoA hydratase / 3-hydroxybutyryl-CoA epimerase